MKIRAGIPNEVAMKARGPTLTIVLRDELAATSWTVTIEATTPIGTFSLGRAQTLPSAASGSFSRRIAEAHVPGVLAWRVRLETPAIAPIAGANDEAGRPTVLTPGILAEGEVELTTGRANGGPALEAVPGASYLLTGVDVDSAAPAQTGLILARPGRVLELSAYHSGNTLAWLHLWRSSAQPAPGTSVTTQPIPLPPGDVTRRQWARPLAASPSLCWSLSTTPLLLTPGAAELFVFAQVE